MSNYLTKEEVRQWRSSLEKITLEEFAQRLGKEIKEEKRTHDIVDMITNNEAVSATPEVKIKKASTPAPIATTVEPIAKIEEPKEEKEEEQQPSVQITLTFNKKLTDREQRVFDYLSTRKGESVKAKDLATILDIPRDYIYKYIRNLRKKIQENVLVNSDEGGFILNI